MTNVQQYSQIFNGPIPAELVGIILSSETKLVHLVISGLPLAALQYTKTFTPSDNS